MKERIKIPKGNDAVFSLYLYAKAQGVYGHIGEELIKVDRKPIILSQVENLSVRLISLFSKQESILPVTIASDETIPNRLQVEFPKELQGEGEYDIIVDFDIPNPSISDKLLHRSTRIPFVCIIPNKNNLDGFSDNINIVIDVMPAIIGEKGEQGERGQDGINGTNGANGKSALDYLNENNSEFIEKLKELLPKGGESGNNNSNEFIDYLFPQNNMLDNDMKEEIRWKLYFILQNFEVVEQGKIKLLQDERERYNDSQADSVINSILPSDICSNFYKYSNTDLYFYPKYIKEINAMEDVYFNYYIFNNNTSNEHLLREFEWKQINLYDNANKIYLLIVEMASKKSILIEMDLTNIKDELKNINGYLMLFPSSDFTEKNVNDMDSLLDNYFFSRIVAQIGGNTDTWRPDRFVSFNVEAVETREFEYLNNSIYNNMLPE